MANPDKGGKLAYLVGIMASLVVVIGFIFQSREYLSYWMQYAVLFTLVLIIIFIVYIFFSDALFAKFNKMKTKRKHNKVAHKHFSELKILVDKFNKSIESNNGITGAFDKLRSETEIYKHLRVPQLNEISNLLHDLNTSIDRFDGTGDDFELLISQFQNILRIYEKFYVKDTLNDIENVKRQSADEVIPKNIKIEYKMRKDAYEKFSDKYIDFGEKVNSEYGSKIVYTYFDKFEEL